MLKRTMALLGLTLTIGALLLALGCSGSSNIPVGTTTTFPVAEPDDPSPSRIRGNGSVSLVSTSSPAVIKVYDPDGLLSITVRDGSGGRLYLFAGRNFPRGATTVQITLSNFGKVAWHWVGFVDSHFSVDSAWRIYPNGQIVKVY